MLENRVVRYLIYSTSAVLLSEVVYYGFLRLRKLFAHFSAPSGSGISSEVAEVIWTNELTQMCSGRHDGVVITSETESTIGADAGAAIGGAGAGNLNAAAVSYIARLPTPTTPTSKKNPKTGAGAICRNRYCAANNVGRLIALLDKAEYSIDLAMYTFTSYELSNAVARAFKRGIDIRIISDKEMVYSSGSQIISLTKAGIPVRCPSTTMLMHHKFCVLDGTKRAGTILAIKNKTYDNKRAIPIVMSGSLNWTMQGFGGNWENIVITSNKNIVNQFEDEYERMWLAFEHKMNSTK